MEDFVFWSETGYSHIIDWGGYDHMLFLLALCCIYTLKEWQWLWVVSAFTIGHAISLALSVLDIVRLPSAWVEVMIPATIAFSCVQNLFAFNKNSSQGFFQRFLLPTALIFGLIHGLGFSNFLRSMLGSKASVFKPLFYFHLGLEFGQILILLAVLSLTTVSARWFGVSLRWRVIAISLPVLMLSLKMLVTRVALL